MNRLMMASLLVLVACGTPAASTDSPARAVIDAFTAAGLRVTQVTSVEHPDDAPWPNTYTEHVTFVLPDLGNKGGHVMVCDTKMDCDAIYSFFASESALTGPYLYQSPNGRVVVQLNSGIAPADAATYEAVVQALP